MSLSPKFKNETTTNKSFIAIADNDSKAGQWEWNPIIFQFIQQVYQVSLFDIQWMQNKRNISRIRRKQKTWQENSMKHD